MAAAPDGDAAELKENRFSYLLQPIRDLAANWDINIAGELEEYLDELEGLTFAIEGDSGPVLNFAEAALLIQGTTCVFSKKVEYLHNLVYQALETIFSKKLKERQAAAAAAAGGAGAGAGDKAAARSAAAAAAAEELDSPAGFLALLGPHQPLEAAAPGDIDLGDDDETAPPELLRPPTALLALEDAACGQGSAAASGSGPGEDAARLARCAVHISGALLLEGRDGALYDALLQPVARAGGDAAAAAAAGRGTAAGFGAVVAAAAAAAAAAGAAAGGGDEQQQQQSQGALQFGDADEPAAHPAAADDLLPDDDAGHEGYGDDDDAAFDAGGADGDANASLAPGTDLDMPDAAQQLGGAGGRDDDAGAAPWLLGGGDDGGADKADPAAGDDTAAAAADGGGRQTRQQRGVRRSLAAAAGAADGGGGYFDPYAPLDPTEAGSLPIKPLQVRKPRKPARLSNLGAATSSSAPAAAGSGSSSINGVPRLNAAHHPSLEWPEFGYLLDKVTAAARLASRQAGRAAAADADTAQTRAVLDWGGAAAAAAAEAAALGADGDEAAAGQDAADWGGGDGYEDDEFGGFDAAGAADFVEGGDAAGGLLRPWAAAALGADGSGGAPSWLGGAGDGSDGGGGMTYEELCRSHIESLITAAAAAQTQSELAQRVSSWRARIDPVLSAEEDRSAFDIHTYGTRILTRLVDVTQPEQQQQQQRPGNDDAEQQQQADFRDVAGASDSFEVCRVFAAMLQLVNNRNIDLIRQAADGGDGAGSSSSSSTGGALANTLQLQLLSVARVHEAMAEGLAGGAAAAEGLHQQQAGGDGQLAVPPPRAASAAAAAKGRSRPGQGKAAAGAKKAAGASSKQQKKGRGRAGVSSSSGEDDGSGSEPDAGAVEDSDGDEEAAADVENRRPPRQQQQVAGSRGGKAGGVQHQQQKVAAPAAGEKRPAAKRARRAGGVA